MRKADICLAFGLGHRTREFDRRSELPGNTVVTSFNGGDFCCIHILNIEMKVEGTVGRELPCAQHSVAVAFKGFVRAMNYGIVNGEISRRSLHVRSEGIPFQLRLRSGGAELN